MIHVVKTRIQSASGVVGVNYPKFLGHIVPWALPYGWVQGALMRRGTHETVLITSHTRADASIGPRGPSHPRALVHISP